MNNTDIVNDDMLVKYLLGEADATEVGQVQAWINSHPANRKHFDQFKLIWDESKKLSNQTTITTDAAWGRFQERIKNEEQSSTQVASPAARTIALGGMSWMKAAAVLVMLIGSGWLIYNMSGAGSGQMLAQSFDKVMMHTLPDGTVVTLNKHSELSYPAHFDGSSRNVTLRGEAFFNVTPDKKKPFIIEAGSSSVTVVGTSFNVKSRLDVTEVIVETGVVQVAGQRESVRLLPGEKVVVSKKSTRPVKEEITDELYNYYRTNEFVCNAVPLSKVVSTLNEAYSANIVINSERIKSLQLSTTLKKGSLEENLEVIAKSFEISVIKNGNQIILKER
jgi:transmembrane sensor